MCTATLHSTVSLASLAAWWPWTTHSLHGMRRCSMPSSLIVRHQASEHEHLTERPTMVSICSQHRTAFELEPRRQAGALIEEPSRQYRPRCMLVASIAGWLLGWLIHPRARARHIAHRQPNHIPSKVMYELDEVLVDLLVFAAKNLRIGGRLVFWLPTTDSFQLTDIPTHPCLTLLAWGEQRLAYVAAAAAAAVLAYLLVVISR